LFVRVLDNTQYRLTFRFNKACSKTLCNNPRDPFI